MPKRRPDHQPLRTCAVCRQVQPKRSMMRLTLRADGSVTADPSGKAPGRGTYVCADEACHEPVRLADGVQRALGVALGSQPLLIEEPHATA